MSQLDLLEAQPALPEGFVYREGILSVEEERELASRVAALELREFEFQNYRGKRRVASFGMRYDFVESRLKQGDPFPEFLLPLRGRAAAFAGLEPDQLAHVLVTEYAPGAPIGWHKDRPVFDDVIGVSLCSACRFRLRRKSGTKWQRASLTLEPRSIYLLRGPSRTEWEHSIPEAEELRYSVTFRSLRHRR